jgi:pre-mRNA-splicing factor SYF1
MRPVGEDVQACEGAPPEKRKPLYMMWAAFEEEYGLARHCYSVYHRAAHAVPAEQRAEVYRVFVAKAKALSGIPKVREVYSLACEAEPPYELPDKDVVELALEFAAVERDLQEIDRARCEIPAAKGSVFAHASLQNVILL